jgi:hypothetical protein
MTKQKTTAKNTNSAVQQPEENTPIFYERKTDPETYVDKLTHLPLEEINKPKLTVVIPYLKSKAQGTELLYSVRSMAKNFREDFNLVVIGDREDWFSDEITYIAHEAISGNPQVDVIDKILTIIGMECVSDGFVWTNDDIYFVSPSKLADIQVLKTEGKLKKGGASVYDQNRNTTIEVLTGKNLPLGNFATHTPVFFEQEKIAELFETVPELNDKGLLFSSLYFNRHFKNHSTIELDYKTDIWKLSIITGDPNPEAFRKYIPGKKWLNNSETGWCKLLQEFLERKFGEICRFEKPF